MGKTSNIEDYSPIILIVIFSSRKFPFRKSRHIYYAHLNRVGKFKESLIEVTSDYFFSSKTGNFAGVRSKMINVIIAAITIPKYTLWVASKKA